MHLQPLAASLLLAAPAVAQSGSQIQILDGCGLNDPATLSATSTVGPTGAALEFRAFDPAGVLGAGTAFAQFGLSIPPSFGPCGLPLPGFGPLAAAGALYLNPAALIVSSGALPLGPGGTPPFTVPLPNNPALAGLVLHAQALTFDFVSGEQVLTAAARVTLGQLGSSGLAVRAVSAAQAVVAPGEDALVRVVVVNDGTTPTPATALQVCDGSGWCGSASVPPLVPGEARLIELTLLALPGTETANPHFFTAKVDVDSVLVEVDESNNERTAEKPLFVTQPILVPPAQQFDEDEIIELGQGAALSYLRIEYGPAGAEAESGVPAAPEKGGVNPDNGFVEIVGQGPAPAPKIDPLLVEQNQALEPGAQIEYVVRYRHEVPMPELPDLSAALDRFDPANLAALELRLAMFEGVRRARVESIAPLVQQLEEQFGAQLLEHYTLAGAFLVRAPKSMLQFLAGANAVLHVERASEPESTPPDSVADGRALIDTDPYFDLGSTGVTYIGLLDTGVRTTHTLFTGDDNIAFWQDCVFGNSTCDDAGSVSYDPDDDFWDHGTSSAAILSGNTDLGDDSRGVTASFVDSWKVYDSIGLDTTAVLRAFDESVRWGDKIVVAEIQSGQSETGSIAEAADDAFEAGCAVIAANGNNGDDGAGSVNSPANAHKVIGVGAYDVDSLVNQGYVSLGPTSDDRYKPDLQAPTNTDTASTLSSTAINNFGGTSGATPYAAGAASVYADWFGLTAMTDVDAGKIYAGLLVGGTNEWDTPFDNTEGVGAFALPLGGTLYTGKRTLVDGQNKYVTIDVPADADTIEAAIWWPEKSGQTHRDIDLYIQRPDGTTSDSSLSVPSVFERVKINNPADGERKIRIHGYDIPLGKSQTVYFAIHVH